jgi:F-type H+-transporting ATPase subunit a
MIIRKFSTNSNILATALLLLFFVFTSQVGFAQEHHAEAEAAGHTQVDEEEFDAGKVILDHVMDSHSWHIMDIGQGADKHAIAIPLPIIIYDQQDGALHMFMSSKFEHGHAAYDGYKLEENTIVRADTGLTDGILDFSITKTTFAVFITVFMMLFIFLSIAKSYKRNPNQAPKGMQSFMEPIILFIRDDVAKPSIGKNYEKYMPFLLTVFFFILISNLMGLIPFFPGGSNIAGNIAVTMVLALLTFIITTASTNKAYWVHIVNMPGVPWWLKFPLPIMPLVELMGVFTKPFVLMVRLFANILAGHIVVLGFVSLIFIFGAQSVAAGYGVSVVSVLFSVFLDLLEILVAFIQAYVFTLLSALYFGMAKVSDH